MKQRREARMEPDRRLAVDRQQLAIAPQVSRARLDNRARDRGLNFRVVVDDLERAEAGLAHVERLDRIFLAALAALQACDVAHPSSLYYPHPAKLAFRRPLPGQGEVSQLARRRYSG